MSLRLLPKTALDDITDAGRNMRRRVIETLNALIQGGEIAFDVRRSTGSQTLNAGATADMVFPTADTNDGTAIDVTTGIFTAPVTGMYFFTASPLLTNNTGGAATLNSCFLSRNGTSGGTANRYFLGQGSIGVTIATGASFLASGSAIIHLAASDTVRVKVDVGGANALTGDLGSRFGGYLLHAE